MRQGADVKSVKNELANYRFYESRILSLTELVDYCYYLLGGVRGSDPSKEPIHSPPNKEMEYKVRDEITRHERNLALVRAKKDYLDEILDLIEEPLKTALIDVYVDAKTIKKVSTGLYMAETTLRRHLDKTIAKALREHEKRTD